MSIITSLPTPNLWDSICKEFEERNASPLQAIAQKQSIQEKVDNYDPGKHNPVFYSNRNTIFQKIPVDDDPTREFNPSKVHPSIVGYSFVQKTDTTPPSTPQQPPDPITCPPSEYLEHYVFPYIVPALEEMLKAAQQANCFIWKRTSFNPLDFLTTYLYRNNPRHEDRMHMELEDIPFVQNEWAVNPRPPLPKSLVWTAPEATLIIQSFFRGYKVRREPDIQEMRQWQKEWRDELEDIHTKVETFWSERSPREEKKSKPKKKGTTSVFTNTSKSSKSRTPSPHDGDVHKTPKSPRNTPSGGSKKHH